MKAKFFTNLIFHFLQAKNGATNGAMVEISLYEPEAIQFIGDDFITQWNSSQFPNPESLPIQFDPQRDGN